MAALPLAVVTPSPCTFLGYCINRSASRHTPLLDGQRDTIIVCSTRTAFIREILIDVGVSVEDIPLPDNANQKLSASQRLLIHTPMAALLTTDSISMVYCPTIHHLRAYLASMIIEASDFLPEAAASKAIRPYLAIHSLLPLHHLSTEWSAQGLSRTVASIIDTANKSSRNLLLSVSSDSQAFGILADLPLVNSGMMKNNTKKKGFYGGEGFEDEEKGQQDLRFIGSVKDVLSRWCKLIHVDKLSEGSIAPNDIRSSSQDMLV
ncbi:hypothetical protein H072_2625 [Dactylellina haptotyla CBS 200.50]|uniref:Uncharacterized protein n=1 Tax=Dactylellina haptotyla (strain CBS 200.50) TaxID=1284197 RepID=S8AKB9_DACHA|nr:hypothetical protein H072_2625 [Dactylellina haptotyla CBS 200.50]